MSKKIKKGVTKKVAPKLLIANQDFYTVINGQKFRGQKGDTINCLPENKDDLLATGFVE